MFKAMPISNQTDRMMNSTKKTAVLTGSTGGIGLEISRILAKQGWNLVLVNRSQEKTDIQLEALQKSYPDQEFTGFIANLMDTSDIKRVATEIRSKYTEISALYNIAGFLTDRRVMSPQNIEGHFALNTIAPYVLTQLLRTQLGMDTKGVQKSVVVNFSSSAINAVKEIDVRTLTNPESIGGLMGAYATSKAALTAVSALMKEELLEDGILIQVVDPGPTKTSMTGSSDGMPWYLLLLRPLLFKSAKIQAQKLMSTVEAAVSGGKSGLFISEGRQKPYPPITLNKEIQTEIKLLLDTQIS
ncbi:MAG: SDR family NAD(P)-dependent oxidoreductase [Cyanobacteria bacterium P01_F01_bin.150]